MLAPSTSIYLTTGGDDDGDVGTSIKALSVHEGGSGQAGGPGAPLQLINGLVRSARPPPTDYVNVITSDDEVFPVKKKLLRPCIALTKVCVWGGGSASP